MKFLQSPPGDEPVKISGLFKAPVARLYKAWTNPEEIKQWFGPRPHSIADARCDLQIDGDWCFVMNDSETQREQLEGKYLAIEENAKLIFSWRHVKQLADGQRHETAYSKVTVDFIDCGDSTQIDLCHEAIKEEDGRLGVGRGWHACFEHIQLMIDQPNNN